MLNRPPPPLNYVRSFESSARHLSFTKAAEELGYTQAAISVHIRSLEQYLGTKLFHRAARSLALTEAGEAFLPTLRQALQMIDHATESVVVGNRRKTVTITCPMSFAENWLAPKLAGFYAAHPDVEVAIHGMIWEASAEPDADLKIIMHRADEAPPGSVQIYREHLSLLAAPHWAEKLQDVSDLSKHPMIVVLGRQDYWTAFSETIDDLDLDITGCIRTNSTNIALEIAASGAGITASPRALARAYKDRGLLIELFNLHPKSPWSYYISENTTSFSVAAKLAKSWILREPT